MYKSRLMKSAGLYIPRLQARRCFALTLSVLVTTCVAVAIVPGPSGLKGAGVAFAGTNNLVLDLRCAGRGIDTTPGGPNDRDPKEVTTDDDTLADCIDPLSDATDTFTGTVRNRNGVRQQNVKLVFYFGQRTNGNAPGANDSTDDATLEANGGRVIGTNPGSLRTACTTGPKGRCSAILKNPTPQAGDTIAVVAAIVNQVTPRSSDSATEQWRTSTIVNGGRLTLKPPTSSTQTGTQATLRAILTNQFGQRVQGGNIDFDITEGPNAGLSQPGMVDAVTNANGVVTFTYTSGATGTDVIQACSETGGSENDDCNNGEPRDVATKTWF